MFPSLGNLLPVSGEHRFEAGNLEKFRVADLHYTKNSMRYTAPMSPQAIFPEHSLTVTRMDLRMDLQMAVFIAGAKRQLMLDQHGPA